MTESPYERRQREAVQRMLKAVMPDFTRLLNDIVPQKQTYLQDLCRLFTPQYQDIIASITKALPRTKLPSFDIPKAALPKFDVPALKIDYQSLFPDFSAIHADAMQSLLPSIKLIQDLQRDQFADVIARVRAVVEASLPPNWRGDEVSLPTNLEQLLLDEGLPLAWVPPRAIIVKLFAAQTPGERRKIIGDRWRTITRACLQD